MTGQQNRRVRDVLFGSPRDPMSPETHKHMALAAFLAWIGIGADGLSSSAYGAAVLASMAVNRWTPDRFSTLSLRGLTLYWWQQRRDNENAPRRLLLSGLALLITAAILVVIVIERFLQGGSITLVITSVVVLAGLLIRRHYGRVRRLTRHFERDHRWRMRKLTAEPPTLDPAQATAVFLVSSNRGIGVHTAERVEALFPGHFRNFIFVSVGTVDSESYGSEQSLTTLQYETRATLDALVNHAQCQGRATRWNDAYGSDRLVFEQDHWWTRWLHNQTPLAIQRVLNEHGLELVLLPVILREKVEQSGPPGGPRQPRM